MQNKEKIKEIGKYLPHGSKNQIAQISGISIQTVVGFFKTGKAKAETSVKLLETAKPFIEKAKELKNSEDALIELLSK